MRKLIILSLLGILSFSSYSQTKNSLVEGRRPFVFAGSSMDPSKNLSLSAEAGVWGISKATSYSLTFDAVTNTGVETPYTYWVGVKPYFTIFDNGKISYMLYVMPKFNTKDFSQNIIEFGFNPNYTINDNILLALTMGNQVTSVSQWNMFFGAGFIFLK
jgi:hypothetical protein